MTQWPMSLFFWLHGCLCCAGFLPSEKPTLSYTGPASLVLLFLPVCVFLSHSVASLVSFCSSLPLLCPLSRKDPPKAPLNPPTPREARDLLAGTALYWPCLAGSSQAAGVYMKSLDGRAWEATEPSESPGSQVANLTQLFLLSDPPHRLPLLFGRNLLRAPTPPLRTKTPKVGRLGLLSRPLHVVPTYQAMAGLGS